MSSTSALISFSPIMKIVDGQELLHTGIFYYIHIVSVIINCIWNKISSYFREPGLRQSFIALYQDSLRYTTAKLNQAQLGIKSFIIRRKKLRYFVRGSPNLGGTCYFNAVLQNLLAVDILRDYFVESVDESFGPVSASLRKLFVKTSVRGHVIDPRPLFESICTKFPGVYSPDKGAHCRDFLMDFVDSLAGEEFTSLKNRGVAEAKFLDTMFRVEHATVTCSKSGRPSVSYKSRLFLVLEVPSSKQQSKKTQPTVRCSSTDCVGHPDDDDVGDTDISTVSLESCLDLYMNPKHQTIGKSKSCSKALHKRMISMLMTNSCGSKKLSPKPAKNMFKVKRDVAKITLISKAPPILTIQLEQVMYDSSGTVAYRGGLKFEETLDLKPYMDPRCNGTEDATYEYRLVGLVEVIRINCNVYHAVAYVRGNMSNGHCAWYCVNDEEVCEVPVEKVLNSKADILFYQRRC